MNVSPSPKKKKRATCLLRSGSANVGTEGPTHHAAVQNAPPQDPVLPVEVGSTSYLPESAPLGQLRGVARVPQHMHGCHVCSLFNTGGVEMTPFSCVALI